MDRQEIIHRLKILRDHAVHTPGEAPFIISLDDGIAICEAIELLMEQEPTVGDWISVRDRLPEKYKDVLAFIKYDGGEHYNPCYEQFIAWLNTDDGDWDSVYDDFNQSDGEVTHWMPLPEPPKEDEGHDPDP